MRNPIEFSRRRFLSLTARAGMLLFAGGVIGCQEPRESVQLPNLPYDQDALAPVISADTVALHYGKHHRGYIDRLNRLVAGTPLEGQSLKDMIRASVGRPDRRAIFNNAAQAWNHYFYWRSLSPEGDGDPPETLEKRIELDFGSLQDLKTQITHAAITLFGSGWVWLVSNDGRLQVVATHNAELPLTKDMQPLLAIDVWEHAYYLDYQNRRAEYVRAVLDKRINWAFADQNLKGA